MISTSEQFHKAIRSDEPQKALFLFQNAAITDEDIDENYGFQFLESVIESEDFAPGSCCASTLNFNLINEGGEWDDFDFGDFSAYLGVRTMHKRKNRGNFCIVQAEENQITGLTEPPFLKFNDSPVQDATEPVLAIMLVKDLLFAFTDAGYLSFSYSASGLRQTNADIYGAPLLRYAESLKRKRTSVCYGHKISGITTGISGENCLTVFSQDFADGFEMIPLGVFTAERPIFSSKRKLSVSATDAMSKFDIDYNSALFSYPTTVFELLLQTCTAAGVELATPSSGLTNGGAVIQKEPDLKNSTLRDILKYIGEITGTFAKVSRSGQLEMRWFSPAGLLLDEHDYTECNIGYYNVAPISNITSCSIEQEDITVGGGEDIFYIQNNPLIQVIEEENV